MTVPFTQYTRPHGRKQPVEIEINEDLQAQADALIAAGYHFDIEVLRTRKIAMYCEKGEDLIYMLICDNGPEVIETVEKLINNSYEYHKNSEKAKENESLSSTSTDDN